MNIVNKEQDMAGKWRVWVEVAENELAMFKFQTDPTEQMVDDAIASWKEAKKGETQRELDMVNEQIRGINERKGVLEKELCKLPCPLGV